MLAECLFTAVLMISPQTEGLERYLPTTWLLDQQIMAGVCLKMDGPNEAGFLIDEDHRLTITYNWMQYIIPLPPNARTSKSNPNSIDKYRLIYVLGEQFAYIGDQYKIMVRIGPTGWQ